MSSSGPSNYTYQLGGSLLADAPTYICRRANDELYAVLKAGEFCYVLNARPMGMKKCYPSHRDWPQKRVNPQALMEAFWDWTGGQPFWVT